MANKKTLADLVQSVEKKIGKPIQIYSMDFLSGIQKSDRSLLLESDSRSKNSSSALSCILRFENHVEIFFHEGLPRAKRNAILRRELRTISSPKEHDFATIRDTILTLSALIDEQISKSIFSTRAASTYSGSYPAAAK